jgi:hypothetical protein
MAELKSSAVVAPVSGAPAKAPRVACTLVSISDEIRQNRKADGTLGAEYHIATLKLENGKTVNGTIPATVVAKGIEFGSTVNCEAGTGADGGPILRVLGTGTARATWADLGMDAPSIEDSVF